MAFWSINPRKRTFVLKAFLASPVDSGQFLSEKQLMAAHANGAKGDFAKTVIMPGDSWWANYIAEHFLDDAREVISVRNMLGYTGSWQGKPVSVMGQSKQRIRFIVSRDRVSARL